jgi:hypothetical protein
MGSRLGRVGVSTDKRVLKTIKALAERLYLAQVLDPTLYKDRLHGGKPQAKKTILKAAMATALVSRAMAR